MSSNPAMRHMLVAELRDRPGVLYRAIGVIRRHGYNVESLVVAPGKSAGVSRMTAVVVAADAERLARQLLRLVDVLSVTASPTQRSEPWPSFTTMQMPIYDV